MGRVRRAPERRQCAAWVEQFGADIPATGARNDRGLAATVDCNDGLFVVGETTGTYRAHGPLLTADLRF